VSIKWGKQELNDLEIDTTQPPLVFKTQIFSMTGVPVERQKIMVKGGMLKDDADWTKLGIKPGQKLMMMGTADAVPVAPTKAIEFVEGTPHSRSLASLLQPPLSRGASMDAEIDHSRLTCTHVGVIRAARVPCSFTDPKVVVVQGADSPPGNAAAFPSMAPSMMPSQGAQCFALAGSERRSIENSLAAP
jgi:hypothetical protein